MTVIAEVCPIVTYVSGNVAAETALEVNVLLTVLVARLVAKAEFF